MSLADRLPRSSMGRGILTLAGGTGLAQAIAAGISPLLSRLYSPADYGVLFVVSSVSGLLVFLATGRYELAIPLPSRATEARRLAVIAGLCGLAASLLLGVVCWRWRAPLFGFFQAPAAVAFWWAIPVTVLAQAAYQVGYYWALRTKAYGVLAATRVWQSLSSAAVSLLVGWLVAGPIGLLVGLVLAQAAGVFRLLRHFALPSPPEAEPDGETSESGLTATARRHARFAFFGGWAGFLNASGTLLPPLLVATLYGQAAAGLLGFAVRLIGLPMQLVGTAVSQVFLAESAMLMRDDPAAVPGLVLQVTRRMLKFSALIVLGGGLSPAIFPWLFGENWRAAGWVAAWLSLPAAAQIIVSPISNLAVLMKRQGLQLALDGLRALLAVLALWLPRHWGMAFLPAMAAFSLTMFALYGVYFGAYMALARGLRRQTQSRSRMAG